MARHLRYHLICGYLAALLPAAAADTANASTLKVAPVVVSLDDAAPVKVIRIQNNGDQTTRIQLRLFDWHQNNGHDELIPTQDVLANPGLFEIAPHETQTVRIGRVTAPGSAEKSYRLLIDEVPEQARGGGSHVTVLLRISMPIFLDATSKTGDNRASPSGQNKAASLTWRAWAESPSRIVLAIENGGVSHVKFNSIALAPAATATLDAGKEAGRYTGLLYVLPGATRRIAIPVSAPLRPGEHLALTGVSEGQTIVANAVIGSKPDAQDPG